ncbi:MAG: tetratricopeptide repeat protein [Alphaproteobacteria bacterium]
MIGRFLWGAALIFVMTGPSAAQTTVPQGYRDAIHWYRAEAERGYAAAQYLLGYMYETGVEIPQDNYRVARDPALARHWYGKAAAQGDARALYRLARMVHEGRGGPADVAEAARLYREAAERGHVEAQSALGYLYALGEGVERDDLKAYIWLSLAARAGDGAAADNLTLLLPELSADTRAAGDALVEAWKPRKP